MLGMISHKWVGSCYQSDFTLRHLETKGRSWLVRGSTDISSNMLIYTSRTIKRCAVQRWDKCWYTRVGFFSTTWCFKDCVMSRRVSVSSLLLRYIGKSFGSMRDNSWAQPSWSFSALICLISWSNSTALPGLVIGGRSLLTLFPCPLRLPWLDVSSFSSFTYKTVTIFGITFFWYLQIVIK